MAEDRSPGRRLAMGVVCAACLIGIAVLVAVAGDTLDALSGVVVGTFAVLAYGLLRGLLGRSVLQLLIAPVPGAAGHAGRCGRPTT